MALERFRYQNPNVLGTVVELVLESPASAVSESIAEQAANTFFDEIDRLEAVFSAFDPASELSRWRRGDAVRPGSSEFAWVMAEALRWQDFTDGLFNPLTGELEAVWVEAERDNRLPEVGKLERLATALARPRYVMVDDRPRPIGDCSRLNLNALAKGHIVDRSIELVADRGSFSAVLVNAGGDLRHQGETPLSVGIEDPTQPFDNKAPAVTIEIQSEALASSGSSRRGFTIEGRRYSHVLDPRNGRSASALGSVGVSIVASSAMVADVVATAASILSPDQALALVEQLAEVEPMAALVFGHDGNRHPSPNWLKRFGDPNRDPNLGG